jgi:hypothetical protein
MIISHVICYWIVLRESYIQLMTQKPISVKSISVVF